MFCVRRAVPPLARIASYDNPPLPLFGNCATAGVLAQFAATLQLPVPAAGPTHDEVTSAASADGASDEANRTEATRPPRRRLRVRSSRLGRTVRTGGVPRGMCISPLRSLSLTNSTRARIAA